MVYTLIILTYLVPVLFTFYMQDMLKLKTNNSGAKRLNIFLDIVVLLTDTYTHCLYTHNGNGSF